MVNITKPHAETMLVRKSMCQSAMLNEAAINEPPKYRTTASRLDAKIISRRRLTNITPSPAQIYTGQKLLLLLQHLLGRACAWQ